MKKYLLSIVLITFLGMLHAQELENPRFSLADTSVPSVLVLESNPVNEMQLNIQIFSAGVKAADSQRISDNITVTRGKSSHQIDVSELEAGNYVIEISQEKKGRIYRKQFTKE